ncbi:hypothetical protein PAHAL_5G234500 [Panicum hallii]|uniref:Uncharacterized protein n=1 Tax=Panicum hallii TaxID=206008 RepID=A0A2S3HTP7_9POAL|nr:hypothetical protein PAHAL_5G234500 [Panicum hallii]
MMRPLSGLTKIAATLNRRVPSSRRRGVHLQPRQQSTPQPNRGLGGDNLMMVVLGGMDSVRLTTLDERVRPHSPARNAGPDHLRPNRGRRHRALASARPKDGGYR